MIVFIIVALCHKIVEDPRLRQTIAWNPVKYLRFSLENKLIWYAHDYTICRSLSDAVPCPVLGHRSTYFSLLPLTTQM